MDSRPLKALLEELHCLPMSQAAIARAVGCSQPTIYALISGQQQETRESIARRIRELHASHCSARFNSQLAA